MLMEKYRKNILRYLTFSFAVSLIIALCPSAKHFVHWFLTNAEVINNCQTLNTELSHPHTLAKYFILKDWHCHVRAPLS